MYSRREGIEKSQKEKLALGENPLLEFQRQKDAGREGLSYKRYETRKEARKSMHAWLDLLAQHRG